MSHRIQTFSFRLSTLTELYDALSKIGEPKRFWAVKPSDLCVVYAPWFVGVIVDRRRPLEFL